MILRCLIVCLLLAAASFSQTPPIEPGVSQELARWRAAHYSDVRYKLNLTLEKMSPVLKGTIQIRVTVSPLPKGTIFGTGLKTGEPGSEAGAIAAGSLPPIILDWRKIAGHEEKSTISNVSINGIVLTVSPSLTVGPLQPGSNVSPSDTIVPGRPPARVTTSGTIITAQQDAEARASARAISGPPTYMESNEHLIFRDGVQPGENVIKLDFTSPILTSGSAITRYVDKEDGSEYIYSLFVPSDASTAFPVLDQPDLKARFKLTIQSDERGTDQWTAVSNTDPELAFTHTWGILYRFEETQPISTYVFAFAVGDFVRVGESEHSKDLTKGTKPRTTFKALDDFKVEGNTASQSIREVDEGSLIFLRRSQYEKFQPHAAEVFRLNREAIKYLEGYFDYKFPFPKYDLVLIPEFPFGGMEHAGATFLREDRVIFPQEPTQSDINYRATLIFHEATHQWFGDTVTMKWFDDLWLKEGFANFMAYKTLEHVMPEANAWKVFYERIKQPAYATDSTRGTTPIYLPIENLSAAKSAYGNIVYNKAPAFLRQAEFYLGEDKFQAAVRVFLKKHEFANTTWEDLVKEFENAAWFDPRVVYHPSDEEELRTKESEARNRKHIHDWAYSWVSKKGLPMIRATSSTGDIGLSGVSLNEVKEVNSATGWEQDTQLMIKIGNHKPEILRRSIPPGWGQTQALSSIILNNPQMADVVVFPNYRDYGYGIFLLDDKSRDYVLKHVQNETDPFLRSMMYGALWDSVREAELDPKEYVELVVRVLSPGFSRRSRKNEPPEGGTQNAESDETTIATLLKNVSTALNYYLPAATGVSSPHVSKGSAPTASSVEGTTDKLQQSLESVLIDRMQNAPTIGQRLTFYRAFLGIGFSEKARDLLKGMLAKSANIKRLLKDAYKNADLVSIPMTKEEIKAFNKTNGDPHSIPLTTKDKFDIVTRLLVLGDPDAPKLLAELEKTETSDEAKRYAYAARAGIATAENRAKYWTDFTTNKDLSESWIEASIGPFNSIRQPDLSLPYLERALAELPNLKRNRKIFFINNWLAAFIGGQRSEEALAIVNKFLADNPNLDKDLRLKILENVDVIERAVKIRAKYK